MIRWTKPVFFLLLLSSWGWSDPRLGVDVHKTSDQVELRLNQDSPFVNVTQKWRENPHRLEIMIPKSVWSGKAVSGIDRGVVQRVEVKSGKDHVLITLFALQSPKMNWQSSADQKSWTLSISTNEISASNEPPRLPKIVVGGSKASNVTAATKSTPKPLPKVVKSSTAPLPAAKDNLSTRSTTSSHNIVDQRLISISFTNKELAGAIKDMAKAAGLEAKIGPEVKGKPVTESFKDTPVAQALTRVLGRQDQLFEVKFEGNIVHVFADESGSGTTLSPVVPLSPVRDITPASGVLVSDYFPLKPDKSVRDMAAAVRRLASNLEVIQDERLNVLFVRGSASELEKVRNLLQNALAK